MPRNWPGSAICQGPTNLPPGSAAEVDLGKFRGPLRARRFDPSAGAWSAAAPRPLSNTGRREFTPPDKTADSFHDWVLVLDAGG